MVWPLFIYTVISLGQALCPRLYCYMTTDQCRTQQKDLCPTGKLVALYIKVVSHKFVIGFVAIKNCSKLLIKYSHNTKKFKKNSK